IATQIEQAGDTVDVVVLDAAVLLEAGWRNQCDRLVFVEVPLAARQERVRARGWSEDELQRREASQWPLDRKRSAADFVVDHSATSDAAVMEV
ncbi:dephospho-CoA kinase, partial [Streptococcus pneumoniae]|uniref:dephospho-CoA kinase n=1 Tax=Streptococcus pneumoniae TaxID=1313 RepID=UPI0012D733C3